MNILNDTKTGASKALSLKNIVFMTITTVVVTLILSRILKNEIVLYDKYGNVTGYGDIQPKLKPAQFEKTETKAVKR
jgi:hypothetical protein